MYAGVDSLRAQRVLPGSPLPRSNRIDVIDVARVRHFLRCADAAWSKSPIVLCRGGATRFGPSFQLTKLHPQHGALDSLEPIVVALQNVVILALGAPVAKHADFTCVSSVARSLVLMLTR